MLIKLRDIMNNIQLDLTQFQTLAASQIQTLDLLSANLNFNPVVVFAKIKQLEIAKANFKFKHIYFKLTDGNTTVNAVADPEIMKNIQDDSIVKVTCFCQPWIGFDKQSLDVKANIIQIQPIENLEFSPQLDLTTIRLKELKSKPHRFPRHQYPTVTFICSNAMDVATDKDFIETFGQHVQYVKFETKQINLSDTQQLKVTIDHLKTDILVIVRGGGKESHLDSFDHESVLQALANYNGYRIIGIGHSTNHNLINLIADHSAITPTAAAEHLKEQLNENYKSNKKLIQLQDTVNRQYEEIMTLKADLADSNLNTEKLNSNLAKLNDQMNQNFRLSTNQYQSMINLFKFFFIGIGIIGLWFWLF